MFYIQLDALYWKRDDSYEKRRQPIAYGRKEVTDYFTPPHPKRNEYSANEDGHFENSTMAWMQISTHQHPPFSVLIWVKSTCRKKRLDANEFWIGGPGAVSKRWRESIQINFKGKKEIQVDVTLQLTTKDVSDAHNFSPTYPLQQNHYLKVIDHIKGILLNFKFTFSWQFFSKNKSKYVTTVLSRKKKKN